MKCWHERQLIKRWWLRNTHRHYHCRPILLDRRQTSNIENIVAGELLQAGGDKEYWNSLKPISFLMPVKKKQQAVKHVSEMSTKKSLIKQETRESSTSAELRQLAFKCFEWNLFSGSSFDRTKTYLIAIVAVRHLRSILAVIQWWGIEKRLCSGDFLLLLFILVLLQLPSLLLLCC